MKILEPFYAREQWEIIIKRRAGAKSVGARVIEIFTRQKENCVRSRETKLFYLFKPYLNVFNNVSEIK